MKIKKIIEYSKWIWIAVVIAAVGYYLVSKWGDIGKQIQQLSISKLLLSGLFLIGAKLLLAVVSKYSIEKEGYALSYLDVFRIVSFTHLAKYIPGGIWHFVGRFNAYNEREMKIKSSTKALIHENFWLLTGSLFVGIIIGGLSGQGQRFLETAGVRAPIYVLILFVLLLWIILLYGYERMFPAKRAVRYYLLFFALLLAWLFLGVSFGFVLPGFSSATAFSYISIYAFGWLVGYLAIFAPGGIGIRETILVWMLGRSIGPDMAIVLSSIHRFVFIVVEILLGGVSVGLGFLMKQKGNINIEADAAQADIPDVRS